MASRRMFSKVFVRDENFIEMPEGAQSLYFHLGIEADDDGCVQPAQVMRITGAKTDSLKILEAKGFVIPLIGGRVMVITHWKMHNLIQKDRYHTSVYRDLMIKTGLRLTKEGMYTLCIQNDSILLT